MIKINKFYYWAFIRLEAQIIGPIVKECWTPLMYCIFTPKEQLKQTRSQ